MRTEVIRAEGKDYLLCFDINTLCLMEASGVKVMDLANMGTDVSIILIRKLFYFGLIKYHKKGLTEEKAGEIMGEYTAEGHSLNELMEKIMNAFTNGLGLNIKEDETPVLEEGK